MLYPSHESKEVDPAKQNEDLDKTWWSKVLFSYKFTIQQFTQRKSTVCRSIGTQFNDCYTQAMVNSPCVMIWGAMSSNGTDGLLFLPIETTMNGIKYCKILEVHMAMYECNMFVHDGAPCHRSKLVSDFLKKNIKIFIWPGYSPDSIQL